MRTPIGSGLVEIIGKEDDRQGFFCIKLVQFIGEEAELGTEEYSRLWDERFDAAKLGKCYYTNRCPIYKKAIKK